MLKKMSQGERQFSQFLESQEKNWIYEPCWLDTGIPCKVASRNIVYIPDFWCPEDNCYYEVSCTRQAYSMSRKKIGSVLSIDPAIKIIIVKPSGEVYGSIIYDKEIYTSIKDMVEKFEISSPTISRILKESNMRPEKRGHFFIYDKKNSTAAIKNHHTCLRYKKIDGDKIKELRMYHRVTRRRLADFLNIHVSLLRKYEYGTIKTSSHPMLWNMAKLETAIRELRMISCLI